VGFALIAARLLSSDRIEDPLKLDRQRYQRPEYRTLIDQIDREFEQHWQDNGLEVAPRADDLAIARRLSLGLTGTVPSLEEIRVLQSLPDDQRLEWWLSRLLEDRRYADYVAERLARAYVGTENGPFIVFRRRRFTTWLSDHLHKNEPYDKIVRSLISGTGIMTDSPSVNFLTVTVNEDDGGQPDPIRLAGRTTRAFLGMRIDCLQCHDDNLGTMNLGTLDDSRGGLQSDFHHLAAFYGDVTFSFFGIRDGEEAYEYQYLDADQPETIAARTPFLPELRPEDGTDRQQLAAWVTHKQNKPFARAIVNRVWAIVFGKPLVDPVDEIPLYETEDIKFPPGLETLAADFVEHGCDLRRLIRLVVGTRAFQLDSRADFEVDQRHEDNWTVFPLTRLRPEQVAGSISQAANLDTIDANAHIFAQLQRFIEQNDFIQRYGDMGEDEFDERAGTVSQRLLMMNGQLVKDRTDPNLFANAATRIAQLAPTDERAIETAYLTVLTRLPSAAELEHFTALVQGSRNDQRSQNLEDLYWVLINCTEFSWNH
jgi:hypothetical protein